MMANANPKTQSPLERAVDDLQAVWLRRNQARSDLAKLEQQMESAIQHVIGLSIAQRRAKDES